MREDYPWVTVQWKESGGGRARSEVAIGEAATESVYLIVVAAMEKDGS